MSTVAPSSEVLQEEDNDVEMNGSSQNGSHVNTNENLLEQDKDDSIDMGTFLLRRFMFK